MASQTHPSNKIDLACNCGKLRGYGLNISPKTGNHIICMCKDCQAFTRFLGRSEDILDENGGTRIFQITPSQIKLEEGQQNLSCVRLSPKGTLRWYANCCNTPIANTTPSPAFPFAAIFCEFIKPQGPIDARLGPIRSRFFGRDGYGAIPSDAQKKISVGSILKTLARLTVDKLNGKAKPSPFFCSDKKLVTEPRVLTKDERTQFTIRP